MDEQQKPDIDASLEEREAELKEEDLEELAGGSGGGGTAPLTPQH